MSDEQSYSDSEKESYSSSGEKQEIHTAPKEEEQDDNNIPRKGMLDSDTETSETKKKARIQRQYHAEEMETLIELIRSVLSVENTEKFKLYYQFLDDETKKGVPQLLMQYKMFDLLKMCKEGDQSFILQCIWDDQLKYIDQVKCVLDEKDLQEIIAELIDTDNLKYIPQYFDTKKYPNLGTGLIFNKQIHLLEFGYKIDNIIQYLQQYDTIDQEDILFCFEKTWKKYPQIRNILKQKLEIEFLNDNDVSIFRNVCYKKYSKTNDILYEFRIETNLKSCDGLSIEQYFYDHKITKENNKYIIEGFSKGQIENKLTLVQQCFMNIECINKWDLTDLNDERLQLKAEVQELKFREAFLQTTIAEYEKKIKLMAEKQGEYQ